jgi:hypothetical protein
MYTFGLNRAPLFSFRPWGKVIPAHERREYLTGLVDERSAFTSIVISWLWLWLYVQHDSDYHTDKTSWLLIPIFPELTGIDFPVLIILGLVGLWCIWLACHLWQEHKPAPRDIAPGKNGRSLSQRQRQRTMGKRN